MEVSHAQMILASAGYYRGAVDGLAGPETRQAVQTVEDNARGGEIRAASGWPDTTGWSWERRLVAAAQRVLDAQAHDPGDIDGWVGPNTREALTQWLSARVGTSAAVDRPDAAAAGNMGPQDLPRQRDCPTFYGQPGGQVRARLTYVDLPFALRIDWNLSQTTRRILVHAKCAPSLEAALIAVHRAYGRDRMAQLGIDRFAGAYNHRRIRGGSAWSMHAYGCAIDFYAQPNGLRTPLAEALFGQPEYTSFLDIMQDHGWLNGGRMWGKDAMHFQRARL